MSRIIGDAGIGITPDASAFRSQADAKIKEALSALKPTVNLNAGINQASFAKTLGQMKAQLKTLSGTSAVTMNANAGPLSAKIAAVTAQAAAMQAMLSKGTNLGSSTSIATAINELGKMDSRIAAINDNLAETGATSKDAFDALTNAVALAESKLGDLKVSGVVSQQDITSVSNLNKALRDMESTLDMSTGAAGRATSGYGFFGAIIRGLSTASIPLFAKTMNDVAGSAIPGVGAAIMHVLPHMLSYASGWHMAAEGVIEFTAVWVPAGIAMAAFAAAAAPEAIKVYAQLKNMNTMAQATGATFADFPKLSGSITAAMKPQVLELYGIALQGVESSSGKLGPALDGIAQGVDSVAAKIVAWMSGQGGNGLETFLHSGAVDAGLLADGFVQVGRILASVLQSVPGYAKDLLMFGDAALTVTADVVKFVQPVLKAFLAIHGAMFYIGLATTILMSFGRAMVLSAAATALGAEVEETSGKMAAFGTVIGSAIGKLGAMVIATYAYGSSLIVLAADQNIAAAASKAFSDAMEAIPFGPVGLALGAFAIVAGIGLYLAFKQSTDAAQKFNAQMQKMIQTSNYVDLQQNLAAAIAATAAKLNDVTSLQAKAVSGQDVATKAGKDLVASYGGQAQYLAELAKGLTEYGAGLGKGLQETAVASIRQNDLAKAFGGASSAMSLMNLAGQKAGSIATDNAAQYSRLLIELKGVAAGYGLMTTQGGAMGAQLDTISISTSAAAKAVSTLITAEQGWLTLVTGGVSDLQSFESGQTGLAKVTHTTVAATLAQQSAFAAQVNAAGTYLGSLQSMSSAMGNTKKSQDLLSTAMKGTVAQLLPMAKGSSTNVAMLSSLAQLVGGPATTSFKALSGWVGNTKDAENKAVTATDAMTRSTANLTNATKNLATALSNDISQGQAATIMTNGITKAQDNFDAAMNGSNQTLTKSVELTGSSYYNAMVKAGQSTTSATQFVDAFMKQQGYSQTAINKMNTYLDLQSAKLNNVRQNANAAQGALQKYAAGSPYAASVMTTVSATGTVQAKGAGPGLNDVLAHVSFTSAGHFASGGIATVPGGSSGGDNMIAAVKSGELIVPSQHAPKFGDMARRAGIPGYASGGVAGLDASAISAVSGGTTSGSTNFGQGVMAAAATDMQTYMKNAVATMQASGGAGGPYSGSGNLLSIAKWFEANGATAAAAAGIASVISGESGGNPESREAGGSGWGLIQWTGNTTGLPAGYDGPTGKFSYDMGVQLRGAMGYIASRGGLGKINAAGSAIGAGDAFSAMEAPAVALSDTRPALANQIYEQLTKSAPGHSYSAGGVTPEGVLGIGMRTGTPYSFGSGEYVGPLMGNQTSAVAGGGSPQLLLIATQQQNALLSRLVQIAQGSPQAYGRALNGAAATGVQKAYYGG